MLLHAFHGFLGRPDDWSFLREALPEQMLVGVDLFREGDFSLPNGLERFARDFNVKVPQSGEEHALIGYSLGGRLALHLLLDAPDLWKRGVVVSAHPGLRNEEERKRRLNHDQSWAKRVLSEPWNRFLEEWNGQSVFAGSTVPKREEKEFERERLSQVLTNCSLATQADLRGAIATLPMPILWVVGEKDLVYRGLAEGIQFKHPSSRVLTIAEAGHRAPWDQPSFFSESVREFLSSR